MNDGGGVLRVITVSSFSFFGLVRNINCLTCITKFGIYFYPRRCRTGVLNIYTVESVAKPLHHNEGEQLELHVPVTPILMNNVVLP